MNSPALLIFSVMWLSAISLFAQQKTSEKTLKGVYKDAFLVGVAVTPGITAGRDKKILFSLIRRQVIKGFCHLQHK